MKKYLSWIGITIVIALLIIGTTWNNQPDEKLKVGVIMPLSGNLAAFGTSVRRGVETALKQSELDPKLVEIFYEDSAQLASQGVSAQGALTSFKRLADQGVRIIIGPFGPAEVLTIAPVAKNYPDLVVISISNCDERFRKYEQIFCVYPSIPDQVDMTMREIKKQGFRNIYLFTEQSEFGLLVENLLKTNTLDLSLTGIEKVAPGQTKDFRTLIAKINSSKPDAVFAMLSPNEGFILLRQYPGLAKNIPLFFSSDVNQQQLRDLFGKEALGINFVARISENYEPTFTQLYKEHFKQDPDYFAALAHSSSILLFETLNKDTRLENLSGRLTKQTSSQTAIAEFRFNDDRTAFIPLYNHLFRDGSLQKTQN